MDIFVARQPIFDKNLQVFGYELLHRNGFHNYYDNPHEDQASSEVITNSFLVMDIKDLTQGKKAFVNFTPNLLKTKICTLFPKEILVIEILENIEPTDDILSVCQELKQAGYLLALDDFIFKPQFQPLIELADIIKVDFLSTPSKERKAIIQQIGTRNIAFLAEKVETEADYREAIEWGYSYFQGYYFSKPIILQGKDVPTFKPNLLNLLHRINEEEPDIHQIAMIIKQDLSLSYKLLRLVNSAAYGFKNRIKSIQQALVLLGVKEIKKWISLLTLKDLEKNRPGEIMKVSLIRAKFGEMLAHQLGWKEQSSEIFLMGMFSLIDTVMGRPLQEILEDLPLSEEVKKALLGEEGFFREIYNLTVSYEVGNWDLFIRCADSLRIDKSEVFKLYVDSVKWADQIF